MSIADGFSEAVKLAGLFGKSPAQVGMAGVKKGLGIGAAAGTALYAGKRLFSSEEKDTPAEIKDGIGAAAKGALVGGAALGAKKYLDKARPAPYKALQGAVKSVRKAMK
jgi:hypothetical protein